MSKKHNCPKATGFALARPRNPLLDDPRTQIGIDQPTSGPLHRIQKAGIIDSTIASEAVKALALEHPRGYRVLTHGLKYST